MLSVILFLIYLVFVSILRYEQPQQQNIDRFIESVSTLMQTEFAEALSTSEKVPSCILIDPHDFSTPSKISTESLGQNNVSFPNGSQPLPASIRGLRAYIVENRLQSQVRNILGKSYSHCKMSDLQLALSQICSVNSSLVAN
jgi:hypothetical protein